MKRNAMKVPRQAYDATVFYIDAKFPSVAICGLTVVPNLKS